MKRVRVVVFIFYVFCIASTIGKSLIDYGYQELGPSENSQDNTLQDMKIIEVDSLSDQALEELCKNFRISIHIKDTDNYINCLESSFDEIRQVNLMKRAIPEDKNQELEGSGDEGEPKETSTEHIEATTVVVLPPQSINKKEESNPSKIESELAPPVVKTEDVKTTTPKEIITTGVPLMYKPGFGDIQKNIIENKTLKEEKSHAEVVKNSNIILAASNTQKVLTPEGEDLLKTGASQEKPTAASPNSYLMIVLAALGIVGILAFAFNYIKKRKEEKQIDEVLKLETEGRELKEMKPLMKSPLSQNGAKSLEYIDAEPQNVEEIDTRLDVEQGKENDADSSS